jgi:hypothetical protein
MIRKDDMFRPLLDAYPVFAPAWRKFVEEWKDHKDGLPLYLVLGELGRHLIDRFKIGRTEEFASVFAVVERWQCEGDDFVREAATVGLLESIQTLAGHEDLDPSYFEKWLGPESKRWVGQTEPVLGPGKALDGRLAGRAAKRETARWHRCNSDARQHPQNTFAD